MAAPLVSFVEVYCIVCVDPAHEHRKVFTCGFDQKMVMIVHQGIGVECDPVYLACAAQQFKKGVEILIVQKDFTLFDAAIQYMVITGHLYSGFPGQRTLLFFTSLTISDYYYYHLTPFIHLDPWTSWHLYLTLSLVYLSIA